MTFRQLMIAIGLLSLCSLQVCSVAAQENPDEGRSDSQASSVGPMQTNLRITNIRVAPFSAARPGRLLAIRAQITNIGDVTQTARVVVRMSNAADQQGGYIVRVPPKGSRVVHLHARVPTKTDAASRVEFFMTLNRPDTEEDIVLANSKGLPITESYSIRLADDRVTTAVWLDSDPPPVEEWAWPPPKPNYAYEMVIGSRVDGGYTRLLMLLNGELIPCQAADWDAIDTLVISEPSIFRDTVAMKTIRDWVSDGGRVWVMLDKVEPVDVLPLLPDGFSITKIDDTELDRAVVDVDVVAQLSPKDRTIESSDPFKFRRVVQRGGHASHSINGDPAAIWIDFGRGHILLTTLEARAWIRPRIGQPSLNPNYTADFTLQPWAGDLGPEFFSPDRMRSPLADEQLDYPMQHIGNPVVSRKVVLSSLAGFLLVLVCAAVGSLRYGALPRFGWAVPFISFTAAVPLIIAALFVRKDIESSSARLQFVEVAPGAQSVHVHEWMATYMGKSDEGKLSSDADARVIWSEQDESQDLRRWVWDDFRRWHISSSDWPIGLWKSQLQYVLPSDSLTVHAELDAQGAKLTIPSRLRGSLEDCVLNCTPGNIVLCDKESSGMIRIAAGAPPAGASWIGGTLVDDEQMRRQSVYGLMRPKPFGNRYPTYPALMGWTKLWDGRPEWSTTRAEPGSALVILPVKLHSVPTGTKVLVPHNFIRLESPINRDQATTAFDNEQGRWNDATSLAAKVALRFTLPDEVLPITADSLTLHLSLKAPQRRVTITAKSGSATHELAVLTSPLGEHTLHIDKPELLASITDGTFDLELDVGERIGQEAGSFSDDIGNWQVETTHLDVHGTVGDR